MPVESVRELLLRALQQRLAAAFPGLRVERNRALPLAETDLPAILLGDGEQTATEGPELGYVTYALQVPITYEALAPTVAGRGALLNQAHAGIVAALCASPIILPDLQPVWAEEGDLAPDVEGGSTAHARAVALALTIRCEVLMPRGLASITHGPSILGAWILGEGRLGEGAVT